MRLFHYEEAEMKRQRLSRLMFFFTLTRNIQKTLSLRAVIYIK